MPNGGYYRRSDGAPLYVESGASAGYPSRECCCTVGTAPCDCSPALDAVYTVTLSGFTSGSGADWTLFNGAWDVEWIEGCVWYGQWDVVGESGIDLRITLRWDAAGERWEVAITLPGGCYFECHLDSTNPCTTPPGGTYTQVQRDALCPSKAPDPIGCVVA